MSNKRVRPGGGEEKGLQPVVKPVIVQPSKGEQAGLQPVVQPAPTTGKGPAGSGGGKKTGK